MNRLLGLFALILALVCVPPAQADDKSPPGKAPADTVKVKNEKGQETTLTPALFAKLPRQSAKVKDHRGNEATYEGVPLAEILRGAQVTLGKGLRGPRPDCRSAADAPPRVVRR